MEKNGSATKRRNGAERNSWLSSFSWAWYTDTRAAMSFSVSASERDDPFLMLLIRSAGMLAANSWSICLNWSKLLITKYTIPLQNTAASRLNQRHPQSMVR